jgi:uncharacterized RDD family membrane protein YckC
MSNVSQGPGWWMASNQKWYPPESHPGYQPQAPNFPGPNSYPGGQASYSNPSSQYSAGPPLADYGLRLGGWLIDWLILLVICGVISALTHSFHYSHVATNFNGFSSDNRNFRWGMPGALLSPLIVIAYGTLMCGSSRAQTLGMMVTRTKAVKVSSGAPIGYPAALGRALFEWLLAVIFFLPWVLDMLFPLWDSQKQTLHDKVSGTIVIRANRS